MSIFNRTLCKNINNFHLTMFLFGHETVNCSWNGKIQNPSHSRLYYVVSGSALIVTDNGSYKLLPGRWYLLPAGCSFDYSCEKEFEHLYFHIKFSGSDALDLLKNCKSPVYIDAPDYKLFDFSSDIKIVDGLIMHSQIYSVVLSILKTHNIDIRSQPLSPCVLKAISYIRKNLSAQLTTEKIAENTFISKSSLTKHFRKELNMSVQEYLYDIIMFEAVQLLTRSSLSILEISENFGFSDQFYFSRRFRQKFGVSPREYRKNVLL